MRPLFACLALLLPVLSLQAEEDVSSMLKGLVKSARAGKQEALAPL